jgi:hypothetical protein
MALKVVVLLAGSTRVSAPLPAGQPPVAVSVLAAVMASAKVQVVPSTLMIAANAAP